MMWGQGAKDKSKDEVDWFRRMREVERLIAALGDENQQNEV